MASHPQRSGDTHPVPDVANLGLVRPPLVYLGSILLGVLLHFASPLPLVRPSVAGPIGAGAVLMAVCLFIPAGCPFRAPGPPGPGNRPTTTILRAGAFPLRRNPTYLSFSAPPVPLP